MAKFLNIILFIGVAHLFAVHGAPTNDDKGMIDAAVNEIEELIKNYQTNLHSFSDEVKLTVDNMTNTANDLLAKARSKLDNATGILQENADKLVGFDLGEKTCGVLQFRNVALNAFDLAQTCSMDHLNKIVDELNERLSSTENVASDLVDSLEKVKACKSDTTENTLKCINEAKTAALDLLKKNSISQLRIENAQRVLKLATGIKSCLALEALEIAKNQGIAIANCIKNKLPDLSAALGKLDQAKEFINSEIIDKLIDTTKKFDTLSTNVSEKIEHGLNDLKNSLENFVTNLGTLLGNFRDNVFG